jgi:predicted nucleic acid-binding protein
LVAQNEQIATSAQVLAEFIHVVTDRRRFSEPMDMATALARADAWMHDRETIALVADSDAVELAIRWMTTLGLGRKRVLDTFLAATYHSAGVNRLATFNVADFEIFQVFDFVVHR